MKGPVPIPVGAIAAAAIASSSPAGTSAGLKTNPSGGFERTDINGPFVALSVYVTSKSPVASTVKRFAEAITPAEAAPVC